MSVHSLSQGRYLIAYLKLHSKHIQNAKYALATVMETLHEPKIFASSRLIIMNLIQCSVDCNIKSQVTVKKWEGHWLSEQANGWRSESGPCQTIQSRFIIDRMHKNHSLTTVYLYHLKQT